MVGVVAFWLLMNGALLRFWIFPMENRMLSLPVEHVFRQMFVHEQLSELVIRQGNEPVGNLTLQPRHSGADEEEEALYGLDFSGHLLLSLPFTQQQPFNWHGTLEITPRLKLRRLRLQVEASLPGVLFDLEIDPERREAAYTLRQKGEEPVEAAVPLTAEGLEEIAARLGLDPAVLAQLTAGFRGGGGGGEPPALRARHARVTIHGEPVQAFNLSLRHGQTMLAEMDLSTLGRVLAVRTALGFTLASQE